MPTLFEKLIAGEIPAEFVHRDDRCVAFKDINPEAPVHLLVVPVEPIPSLREATDGQRELLGHCLRVCEEVATAAGCAEGYRVVTNIGDDGGQSVPHLHFHVLGGRPLGWPPG